MIDLKRFSGISARDFAADSSKVDPEDTGILRADISNPLINAMRSQGIGALSQAGDTRSGQQLNEEIVEFWREEFKRGKIDINGLQKAIDESLTRAASALDTVFSSQTMSELTSQGQKIRAGVAEFARISTALNPNNTAAKNALASTFLGGAFSGISDERRDAIIAQASALVSGNPDISATQLQETLGRRLKTMTQLELMESTSGKQFLKSGQYRTLNEEIKAAEDGGDSGGDPGTSTAIREELTRKITSGITGSIKELRQIERNDQNGSFLNFFMGTSSSQLGLSRESARSGLIEGIVAAKDQLKRSAQAIGNANIEIQRIRQDNTLTDDEKRIKIGRQNEIISEEEGRQGNLTSLIIEANAKLSAPIKEAMKQVGDGVKTMFGSIVQMLGVLGNELYRQLMQLGRATLNPMVTDLIESMKYGLDVGLKVGQIIAQGTKGLFSTISGIFGGAGLISTTLGTLGKMVVGPLASVKNVLGADLSALRNTKLGQTLFGAANAVAAVPSNVGGWFRNSRVGRNISAAQGWLGRRNITGSNILRSGVAGAAGFIVGEILGEGIRGLGSMFGKMREKDGTYTEAGKRNEMWASTLQGVAQGAGVGAAIGAFIPGGMIIGAGIGAVAGGISGWMKGKSTIDDENAKAAQAKKDEEEALRAQSNITAYQSGALMIPGLNPADINPENIWSSLSAAKDKLVETAKENPMAAAAVTALAGIGVVAGGSGLAGNLMANITGFAGGAVAGITAGMVDFFLKTLNRGAEGMQKFAAISDQINLGLNAQFRLIGNRSGGGNRGLLTESDLSQYFLDFLQNRGLNKMGYTREQVGTIFSAASSASLMGVTSLSTVVESSLILAKRLGVDPKALATAYAEADKSFGIGRGAEMFNRVLLGAAPISGTGEYNAASLQITQALISAGRQLQMTNTQTLSSGKDFTGFMTGLYTAVTRSGSDYGNFILQNPEALSTITDSVNNFFKAGITGQNPLAMALGFSAGMSPKQMYQGGATSNPQTFEAAMGSVMDLLPAQFWQGGGLTEKAINDYLPLILPQFGLNGSVESWAEIFQLVREGRITEATEKADKLDPQKQIVDSVKNINDVVADGIPRLIGQAEKSNQESLKLMENNIKNLERLSTASHLVGTTLLKLSQEFMGPAIGKISEGLLALAMAPEQLKQLTQKGDQGSVVPNAVVNPLTPAGVAQQFTSQFPDLPNGFVSPYLLKTGAFKDFAKQTSLDQLSLIDDFAKYKGSTASLFGVARTTSQTLGPLGLLNQNVLPGQIDSLEEFNESFDYYNKFIAGYSNLTKSNVASTFGYTDLTQSQKVATFLEEDIAYGISGYEWLTTLKDRTTKEGGELNYSQSERFAEKLSQKLEYLQQNGIDTTRLLLSESLGDVYGYQKAVDVTTAKATVVAGSAEGARQLLSGEAIFLALPTNPTDYIITGTALREWLQQLVNNAPAN